MVANPEPPLLPLAPRSGEKGWSLDIPFERPARRSVQLQAAVGGSRSIAPGFSRVETAQIELSPCSGRQAAEVPWATGTSAGVEPTGSRRMRSTCGRESVARYAGSIHEAHRSPG